MDPWRGRAPECECLGARDSPAHSGARLGETSTGAVNTDFTSYGDPNPFFGRVVYTPGLRLDQPLSVTRFNYVDRPAFNQPGGTPWVTVTLMPFWNARGNPTYGAFSNGWVDFPYVKLQNQSQCADPSRLTLQRCVTAFWNIGWSAYDQRRGTGQTYSWMGSLLENKRNAVGLDYKRARMYDPQMGQFTQEDPMGARRRDERVWVCGK